MGRKEHQQDLPCILMCSHRRGSVEFFFLEDSGLEGGASDSDDGADDGYYSEDSNTSE